MPCCRFCYNEVPFSIVAIPVKNCIGDPDSDIYGFEGVDGPGPTGCEPANDGPFVNAEGYALGDWGRGAVHLVDGGKAFSHKIPIKICFF